MTLSEMVASIDKDRRHRNLSSGIRLFVLDYYRNRGGKNGRSARDLAAAYSDQTAMRAVGLTGRSQ